MFTALLIAILIVGGVTGGIAGALFLSARKHRALEQAASPRALGPARGDKLLERGIGDLRPGDVIQRDGRDWIVEGVLQYDEDGHRWNTGRLVDMDDERWLVVGMDRSGAMEAHWMRLDPDVDVGSYPPETITAEGKRFPLDKRGNATVKVFGEGGSLPTKVGHGTESVTRCRWWRYRAAGRDCLIIEDWSGDFRSLRGQTVQSTDIEFMPGS